MSWKLKAGILFLLLAFALSLTDNVWDLVDHLRSLKQLSLTIAPEAPGSGLTLVGTSTGISWGSAPFAVVVQPPALFATPPPEIRPPRDHPPLKIVAGQYLYTVHYTTHAYMSHNGVAAYTDVAAHQIWLQREPHADTRETVIHELLHVALREAGGPQRGDDHGDILTEGHDVINPAAPGFAEILEDNPRLTAWLGQ